MTMPDSIDQTCAICGEFVDFKSMKFTAEYFGPPAEVFCDACLEKFRKSGFRDFGQDED